MSTTRSQYQVHARIQRSGSAAAPFDDAKAGYPLARRINRMERVAACYHGAVETLLGGNLLMTFASADAALLSACEMQQRCAGLPQTAGHRLALRIGIHQGPLRQRAQDDADETRDITSRLAIADDEIIATENVVADLNPELRKISHPINATSIESFESFELAVHKINWRSEIPAAAYGGETAWPASRTSGASGPYLVLHLGMKTLELSYDRPVATVGRAPSNDLVVADLFVSRKHCRIERQSDCIVLTDWSTNGTCVLPDNGEELLVKNDSLYLKGKGLLFFGRLCNGERRGGVRFETD